MKLPLLIYIYVILEKEKTRGMSSGKKKLEEARDIGQEDTMEMNEMEQNKVSLMRDYVESQDPSSQVLLLLTTSTASTF